MVHHLVVRDWRQKTAALVLWRVKEEEEEEGDGSGRRTSRRRISTGTDS